MTAWVSVWRLDRVKYRSEQFWREFHVYARRLARRDAIDEVKV